jgi:hypothetical protein
MGASREFSTTTSRLVGGTGSAYSPTNLTLCIWAIGDTLPATSGINGRRWLMSKGNGPASYEYALLASGNGTSSLPKMDIYNTAAGGYVSATGTTALSTGVPYFFCGSYDNASTTVKVYLNAVEEGSNSTTSGTRTGNTSAQFWIGDRHDGATNEWNGALAHGMLYNRVLTIDEMRELMFNPYAIPSGRVGHWPISGVDSPELDVSGNGNNLTVNSTSESSRGFPIFIPSSPRTIWTFDDPTPPTGFKPAWAYRNVQVIGAA